MAPKTHENLMPMPILHTPQGPFHNITVTKDD